MRWDQLPRSDNVEDQRGAGPRGFPTGRAGGIGIGTLLVLVLIGWALGINPLYLLGGAEILSRLGGGSQEQSQPAPKDAQTQAPSDRMGQFVSAVLGSTEAEWKEIFAQAGKTYKPPTLVMFSGATRSACGCPVRHGSVLLPDRSEGLSRHSFFQDLERRFRGCEVGSKSCQFSQAYVITHEIGHHVQNLLGSCPRCRRRSAAWTRSKPISSRCGSSCRPTALPGSGRTTRRKSGGLSSPATWRRPCRRRRPSGMIACSAAARATSFRRVHAGSSEQRTRWFLTGLKSARLRAATHSGASSRGHAPEALARREGPRRRADRMRRPHRHAPPGGRTPWPF